MSRTPNETGIHVEGYLEDELERIAYNNERRYDHRDSLFAETLLVLLKRTGKRGAPE